MSQFERYSIFSVLATLYCDIDKDSNYISCEERLLFACFVLFINDKSFV
jgi:hypothetical protein